MSGPKTENAIVKYFKDFKVLKETRREYWGLQAINMVDCLAYFAMFNIAVVSLSNDFGFNDVDAGLIYTLFASLTTIMLFVSGALTDWLGIRRALYVAVFGMLLLRLGVVATAYMGDQVRLDTATELSVLDDGRGVPVVAGSPDLEIQPRKGPMFLVDLSGAATIGDVIERIEQAPGNDGRITAGLAPGGRGLQVEDTTHGTGELKVLAPKGSPDAAARLGFTPKGTTSDTLAGLRILTPLNGVALSEINQGEGLGDATTLTITSRSGGVMNVPNVHEFPTVPALLAHLNATAKELALPLSFGINNAGTGLIIRDGGREGTLTVAGDAAEALHIEGIEDGATITGGNLLDSPLRSLLVILLLASMAPFMAMLQTVFQAANRRFTTKRSRGAGFNLWYLFMNVGAAGGGFLIDIIYLDMDLPHFHVFTFGVGASLLCLALTFFTIKNTEQLRSPDEEPEPEPEPDAAKDKRNPLTILRDVASEKVFWRFVLLISLLLGVRAVFLYLGLLHPKFWYRVIGPDAQVGALQAFNPVLVIFGLILFIPVLNRFNVYKMLVFGALITSLSMFIIAIPPTSGVDVATWTYGTTIAFLLFLTIGELIWSPRLSEYTAAIAPEGQEGTYLGLSMVPYFLAKLVVSGLSGAMLNRWCPAPPESNPLQLQEQIASGDLAFVDSPYMMFTILGAVALAGTLLAIVGRRFFTEGTAMGADGAKAEPT